MNALLTNALRPGLTGLVSCLLPSLALNGSANPDEAPVALPLVRALDFERSPEGVCTITFSGEPGIDYTILASCDLVDWVPLGICEETSPGNFQIVDEAAVGLDTRIYQLHLPVGIQDPSPERLPGAFEQLRLEMGDEAFAEWLRSNMEQWGNYQAISGESLEALQRDNPEAIRQVEETERQLENFLNNAPGCQNPPPIDLPGNYEALFLEMGEESFAEMLWGIEEQWGNYQGICGTALLEMARLFPVAHEQFLETEEQLGNFLIGEPGAPTLPENFEQLRLELGDEGFAEWLHSNMEQTGNHQGIAADTLDEMQRDNPEAFQRVLQIERQLENFLNNAPGAPNLPPADLPEHYELLLVEMGEVDFSEMLLASEDQWGNYQWICGTALLEMARNYPALHQQFLETEQQLEDFLIEVPSAPNPPQGGEVTLPANLEQLRLELGDEGFAQWLRSNKEQTGSYQGVDDHSVAEMQRDYPQVYEQFQATERKLEQWLAGRD